MRAWWLIVVAACGGGAAPISRPHPVHAIAKTSCADAGVILRGPVQIRSSEAGREREAAITRACSDDRWSAAALDCIGSSRAPLECLDKHLPPQVVTSYQMALAEWAVTFEGASDLDVPDKPPVSCDQVVDAVEKLSDDVAVEREWAMAARRRFVESSCIAGWSQSVRQCFVDATQRDALAGCAQEFAANVATIAARASAIAAAKQKPASIACAKVTDAYYSDASFKPALERMLPSERAKAVSGSRAAMVRACTRGAWGETLRACLASGGDASCFADTNVTATEWGYPAAASGVVALPATCDRLAKIAVKLAACKTLDANIRTAVIDTLHALAQEATRTDVTDACDHAAEQLQGLPGC
jgi:hypothetical protein